MLLRLALALPTAALLGCASATAPTTPTTDDAPFDLTTLVELTGTAEEQRAALEVDRDLDGVGDLLEDTAARVYLPFLSGHPDDACPLSGIVFRARPHPDDARLLHVTYSRLYERDCGLSSHVGDNEAFGATIDPSAPPPLGLVALRAVSHQGTPCERTTTCGSCPGLGACTAAPDGRPALFSSRDKHGGAVDIAAGCGLLSCFDSCEMSEVSDEPPLLNVGEPDAPLVSDLTDAGFIHAGEGWTNAAVFHHDPWGDAAFGGAGVVAGDLVDDAFVTPACIAP